MGAPGRIYRAPYVKKGDPLRASTWNRLAQAINTIIGPVDLDAGSGDALYVTPVRNVIKVTRRVENPDDASQYVDVDDVIAFDFETGQGLLDAMAQGLPVRIYGFDEFIDD